MTVFLDGIGQKINSGDFVMSVRDGTGAKPRIVLSFTVAKVRVSDRGNTTSVMDPSNLVVITDNIKKLIDANDPSPSIAYTNDLTTNWASQIVTAPPPPAKAPPLRFLIVGHLPAGGDRGAEHEQKSIQQVSIHEVRGSNNDAAGAALEESKLLSATMGLALESRWTLHREAERASWRSKEKTAWYYSYGTFANARSELWPLKQLRDYQIDGLGTNQLIPVDHFNAAINQDLFKVTK